MPEEIKILQFGRRKTDRLGAIHDWNEARKHYRILVADWDETNMALFLDTLSDRYHTERAVTADEFERKMYEFSPDMVLLSYGFNSDDGIPLAIWMKQRPEYVSTPVIMMLRGDTDIEVEAMKTGVIEIIRKPIKPDLLLLRVDRMLELRHLQTCLENEVDKQMRVVEKRNSEITTLLKQSLVTLASAVDAKDHYTNGHSSRVAEYSREIARRAGKTERAQNEAYYAGLLHDIGKIGVPDSLIAKCSGLTDEEYKTIRRHPEIGAEILGHITEMPNLAVAAYHHHEHYDGSGYPDHLKGEDIPDIARLIAVADAYDAMTSRRSYRDVLPQEVAKNEIKKGRGTQFDPLYADIMIGMIDEDKNYDMREK